jgi:hypothetical protein
LWRQALYPSTCLCLYAIFRTPSSINRFLGNSVFHSEDAKSHFPLFNAGLRVCEHPRGFCRSSPCSENPSLTGHLQPWKTRQINDLDTYTITRGNNSVNCKSGCFPSLTVFFDVKK